ncbi:hypothetical protein AF67_02055 [Streptococcus uberis 6780]|nr:hypothetical protein AF67_02055 [Streptococcus uberis 6780]
MPKIKKDVFHFLEKLILFTEKWEAFFDKKTSIMRLKFLVFIRG